MAYVELTPYDRGQRPALSESDRDYMDRELKKLEAAIRSLKEAIEELRVKKANA
jgi:hypothetical protein